MGILFLGHSEVTKSGQEIILVNSLIKKVIIGQKLVSLFSMPSHKLVLVIQLYY